MKEKILEQFDEKKFKWYDTYNNDFICINDHPLSDEIKNFISQALDEYAKPKCSKCFDKGYRTELKGVRDLGHNKEGKTYSDSSGEQINTFTSMEFCNCDRGKELEIRVKEYADWKIKECLPEKRNRNEAPDGLADIYDKAFNACIDQILINKDKIN